MKSQFIKTIVVAATLFILILALSYWTKTDFPLGGAQDRLIRLGYPLVFFESGGFAYRRKFDGVALCIDLLLVFAVSAVVVLLKSRSSKSHKKL